MQANSNARAGVARTGQFDVAYIICVECVAVPCVVIVLLCYGCGAGWLACCSVSFRWFCFFTRCRLSFLKYTVKLGSSVGQCSARCCISL